jgi:Ca2+-binding RTX toxin-like protein
MTTRELVTARSTCARSLWIGLLASIALLALPGRGHAFPTVYQAHDDITATVNAFRAALGNPSNGSALGPLATGRREINWDAGIVPFAMPGDFFNATVTRGAVFSTAGSGFRVSNDGVDVEFNTFNAGYPAQFTTFSSPRLFTPLDSNVLDVHFFVAGSDLPATVSGFGAVFTDVDLPASTQLEFFDAQDSPLLSVPVATSPGGLSFLGAVFDTDRVFRVRITSGNTPITAASPDDDPGKGIDVVVMDDFIYGEPISTADFCVSPIPTNGCTVNGVKNQPCIGTDGDDVIIGTDGPDVIVGLDGNDVIKAKKGNDVVCAGAGNDRVTGDTGNDLIAGQEGDDRLRGDRGDDILVGGPGNDDLAGGAGIDTLIGDEQDDYLRGDRGDDQLDGGLGDDTIIGGKGTDDCSDPDAATMKSCE